MQRILLNRMATVKDNGTVEVVVPGDVEPRTLGVGSDYACNTVADDEPLDATDQYIPPLQIVILIVGTRGDVQPFIAIGKRLQVSRWFLLSAFQWEPYSWTVVWSFNRQI